MKTRKLVTVGHSYVVSLNRRLAHEMAIAGRGKWEVTCVAPRYFHGGHDLAPLTLNPSPNDAYALESVPAYLTSHVHVFSYGAKLRSLLNQHWDLVHAWEEPYVLAGESARHEVGRRLAEQLVFLRRNGCAAAQAEYDSERARHRKRSKTRVQ